MDEYVFLEGDDWSCKETKNTHLKLHVYHEFNEPVMEPWTTEEVVWPDGRGSRMTMKHDEKEAEVIMTQNTTDRSYGVSHSTRCPCRTCCIEMDTPVSNHPICRQDTGPTSPDFRTSPALRPRRKVDIRA